MSTFKKLTIALLVSAAALVGICMIAGSYYETHFFPNTTINNLNVSNMTLDQAKTSMEQDIGDYCLQVVDATNAHDNIYGIEVALDSFVTDTQLLNALDSQNGYLWPIHLFCSQELNVDMINTFDEALLKDRVARLNCHESDVLKGTNAKYYFNQEQNKYVIYSEEYGDLDEARLYDAVKEAISKLEPSIVLVDAGAYVTPKTIVDLAELQEKVDLMNNFAPGMITYTLSNGVKEVLSPETTMDWISFSEGGEIKVDDEKVAHYIDTMKAKYDTTNLSRKLVSSYNGDVVNLRPGTYGFSIDKEKEVKQLIADLVSREDVSRDFIYASKAASRDPDNDIGGTYIEVDLTYQHVYMYKKGELIMDTDCVTGHASQHATNQGAYYIYGMARDRILRGPGYASFVNYWMPYNGGEGLHDAMWRDTFGGNIYMNDGSHGCTNMPREKAGFMYENAYCGYPVFVFHHSASDATYAASHAKDASEIDFGGENSGQSTAASLGIDQ